MESHGGKGSLQSTLSILNARAHLFDARVARVYVQGVCRVIDRQKYASNVDSKVMSIPHVSTSECPIYANFARGMLSTLIF